MKKQTLEPEFRVLWHYLSILMLLKGKLSNWEREPKMKTMIKQTERLVVIKLWGKPRSTEAGVCRL